MHPDVRYAKIAGMPVSDDKRAELDKLPRNPSLTIRLKPPIRAAVEHLRSRGVDPKHVFEAAVVAEAQRLGFSVGPTAPPAQWTSEPERARRGSRKPPTSARQAFNAAKREREQEEKKRQGHIERFASEVPEPVSAPRSFDQVGSLNRIIRILASGPDAMPSKAVLRMHTDELRRVDLSLAPEAVRVELLEALEAGRERIESISTSDGGRLKDTLDHLLHRTGLTLDALWAL